MASRGRPGAACRDAAAGLVATLGTRPDLSGGEAVRHCWHCLAVLVRRLADEAELDPTEVATLLKLEDIPRQPNAGAEPADP